MTRKGEYGYGHLCMTYRTVLIREQEESISTQHEDFINDITRRTKKMNPKKINRLKQIVFEYRWSDDYGLIVFVYYDDCRELFTEICPVYSEIYPDCKACDDCIAIHHFDEFLEQYTTETIDDIFPKEDEQ